MGIKIDKRLDWVDHVNEAAIKLNRTNVMLYKVREYVSTDTLKPMHYAILDSHPNCGNLVWRQIWIRLDNYSSEKNIKVNELQA